jgi:hypothetical protein
MSHRGRRCVCGESTRYGLGRCLQCFVDAERSAAYAAGRSLGRAEGEVRTLERWHREGRLRDAPTPPAANGKSPDRPELRLLLQVVHPDRNSHPMATKATQIVLRMLGQVP